MGVGFGTEEGSGPGDAKLRARLGVRCLWTGLPPRTREIVETEGDFSCLPNGRAKALDESF